MLRNSLSSRRAIPVPDSQQFRSGQTGIACGRIPIRPEPSPCCPAPNRTQRVRCGWFRSPDRQAAAPARKGIRPWSRLFRCPRIGTSLPDSVRPVLSHAGATMYRRELRSSVLAPIASGRPVISRPSRRLDAKKRTRESLNRAAFLQSRCQCVTGAPPSPHGVESEPCRARSALGILTAEIDICARTIRPRAMW